MIAENHPLNPTPLGKVFPIFQPILGLCQKNEEAAASTEEQRLLPDDENKKTSPGGGKRKLPKIDKDSKEDPFNFLGFGMVAYRDIMLILFFLFTFFTILTIPIMVMYKSGKGISLPQGYASFSLGNLGYSST
jgi:hypothetical protein